MARECGHPPGTALIRAGMSEFEPVSGLICRICRRRERKSIRLLALDSVISNAMNAAVRSDLPRLHVRRESIKRDALQSGSPALVLKLVVPNHATIGQY